LARRALLVALLALITAVPVARADGDPASDYLLGQASFIPPDAGVPSAYATQLEAALREAKARGYEIRVALISSRYDMGSVTVLYNQPKRYARFLGQELFFVYKGNLLVVMPNGLGFSHGGKPVPASQAVAGRVPAPGKSGAALASAATRAVIHLAADSGAIVPTPPLTGATSGPNTNRDRVTIGIGAAVIVAALAGFLFVRRRMRKVQA
jgi:hypothetical protein